MEKDHLSRKLAVLLHADVVGSTSLVQKNETLAHERIQASFDNFSETIKAYGGIAREIRGDALVAEFERASDAIPAALAFQALNAEFNSKLNDDIQPHLRIGISLGEVIIADNTITGAGIVLAQRLEQLAESGGVVVQGAVSETVPSRMPFEFVSLGEQVLKGFDQPVRAFAANLKQGEELPTPEAEAISESAKPTALPIPENPSIAVLPFTNMSGDPEQEYFADGITEDIITALSKFRWFFVVSRNSTFVYKGKAVDIKQVGRELGVRYVLEGSVRKSEHRVRISAQLIETRTGNHVWAERFDRQLDDMFELQDEITSTIAAAVEPELSGSERHRAMRQPTENLGAWDYFHRGVAELWRQEHDSLVAGIKLIRKATTLDPGFGQAYGYLAFAAFFKLVYEWAESADDVLRQGLEDAAKAVAIDQRDYFAFHVLGRLQTLAGGHRAALSALETCLEINPNFALGYVGLGEAHVYAGNPTRAIEYLDTAIQLSPNDPFKWDMYHYKASAYIRLDDFDQAIENFEKACEFPTAQYVPFATLAALYVIQGRAKEGAWALENSQRLEPKVTVDMMKKVYGVTEEKSGSRSQRLLDALRAAGMSED
jgi:adenylate cyclase